MCIKENLVINLNTKYTNAIIKHHFVLCNASLYLQQVYATLSHLRSKEFQRIHIICKYQHGETSKCRLRCILVKWSTFIKAGPFIGFIPKSIVGISNIHVMITTK